MTHSSDPPDLLVGDPERALAYDALAAHAQDNRIDAAELERRTEAVRSARTRSELLRIFADLPGPHPLAPEEDDEDLPPAGVVAGCLTLGLGLPVAVVLGIVYGTWWALAVPVAVTVLMAYAEHLRSPRASRKE